MKRGLLSWLLHKKERLSDYRLQFGTKVAKFLSELKLVFREPFLLSEEVSHSWLQSLDSTLENLSLSLIPRPLLVAFFRSRAGKRVFLRLAYLKHCQCVCVCVCVCVHMWQVWNDIINTDYAYMYTHTHTHTYSIVFRIPR